jgi:hypothetical protein
MINNEDPDEDAALEAWLELTEAEQDRELESAMQEYREMIDAMPHDQYLAHRRRRTVEHCLRCRKLIKALPGVDIFPKQLRDAQKRLLMIRLERLGKVGGTA